MSSFPASQRTVYLVTGHKFGIKLQTQLPATPLRAPGAENLMAELRMTLDLNRCLNNAIAMFETSNRFVLPVRGLNLKYSPGTGHANH